MLKKALSLLIIASLTISPSTLVLAGQTTTPARSGATAPPAEPDLGWPRGYSTPAGANLILYQPQIASWTGQSQMTAYAAVSYQAKGAKEAALGTLKIESNTRVAVEERLVNFSQFTIGAGSFSDSRERSGRVRSSRTSRPQYQWKSASSRSTGCSRVSMRVRSFPKTSMG